MSFRKNILIGQNCVIKGGGTVKGYIGTVMDYRDEFPFQTITVRHPVTGVELTYDYNNVFLVQGSESLNETNELNQQIEQLRQGLKVPDEIVLDDVEANGFPQSVADLQQLAARSAEWGALNSPVAQAVDDGLVNLQSTLSSYPSAKEALEELINWHVAVALDPRISNGAISLINKGAEQQREIDAKAEPAIPAEIKGRVQAEWFWKGVLATQQAIRSGGK